MPTIGRRHVLVAVAVIAVMACSELSAPPPTQSISDNVATKLSEPSFEVRWVRDELRFVGHTFSSRHEDRLLQSASRVFPNARVTSSFEPLGIVPNYWSTVTLALPALLQGSSSGHAEVSESTVTLSIVSSNTASLNTRIAVFARQLPSAVELHTDVITIDANFSVAEACSNAFASFAPGEISFEENSSVFRPSAFPRLQRVAALSASCATASLQITGHTDASGSEAWNTSLSLQRANAVADYLATLGLDKQRMQVKGAGSSLPLFSNATRYGRSKNRRIEIAFELT